MKKQYTITENNDWEGEVFGYILELTPEEYAFIVEQIKEDDSFSIEESNYTLSDVKLINKHERNTYKDRLNFYKFEDNLFELYNKLRDSIDSDEYYTLEEKEIEKSLIVTSEILYKGKGLKRTTKKKSENG